MHPPPRLTLRPFRRTGYNRPTHMSPLRAAAILCLALPLLAADDAELRALVARLGADEAEAREAASAELRRLGEADETGAVEKALSEATSSTDPEVATRSRTILDGIRYWDRIVVLGGMQTCAVDVSSGAVVWTRPGWHSAWAGTRRRGAVAAVADRDGGIEGVDLRTGRTRWRAKSPAWGEVIENAWWLGYGDTTVARVDLADGKAVWSVDLPKPIHRVRPASVLGDGHGVYVETEDGVVALDAATGAERWRTKSTLLGLARGGLYLRDGETAVRVDAADGTSLWRRPDGASPVTALFDGGDGLALLSNDAGTTFALEPATGKERWTLKARPIGVYVGEPYIWVATEDELLVVALEDGRVAAHFPREHDAVSFARDGDSLLVADYEVISCEVSLRAFDVPTRTLRWTADVEGTNVDHSKYWQHAWVERLGDVLAFCGEAAGGNWVEVVDPATGQIISRHHPR